MSDEVHKKTKQNKAYKTQHLNVLPWKEITYKHLDFSLYYEYDFTSLAISNCSIKSKHERSPLPLERVALI